MKPCDHPVDIALLRFVMQEPDVLFYLPALAGAIDWLGDNKLATTKNLRAHLRKLTERGLLRQNDVSGFPAWQFERGASVQQATGGIDPLTVGLDELLTAYSWRQGRAAEYDRNAHRKAPEGTDRIERAMRQVSSPWQYADRLRRL